MNNQYNQDFYRLTKASLHDLKELKIVKSISVQKNDSKRYVATVEDYYSNAIDILVGLKSSDYIYNENGFLPSLEGSAYIVLLDNPQNDLRITTSLYASNGEFRKVFEFPISPQEIKELLSIKEILLQRGLRI